MEIVIVNTKYDILNRESIKYIHLSLNSMKYICSIEKSNKVIVTEFSKINEYENIEKFHIEIEYEKNIKQLKSLLDNTEIPVNVFGRLSKYLSDEIGERVEYHNTKYYTDLDINVVDLVDSKLPISVGVTYYGDGCIYGKCKHGSSISCSTNTTGCDGSTSSFTNLLEEVDEKGTIERIETEDKTIALQDFYKFINSISNTIKNTPLMSINFCFIDEHMDRSDMLNKLEDLRKNVKNVSLILNYSELYNNNGHMKGYVRELETLLVNLFRSNDISITFKIFTGVKDVATENDVDMFLDRLNGRNSMFDDIKILRMLYTPGDIVGCKADNFERLCDTNLYIYLLNDSSINEIMFLKENKIRVRSINSSVGE